MATEKGIAMLERQIIQDRGFNNVVEDGRTTGFTVALKNPNYRGLSSSLVDGVAVNVDGRGWSHEETCLSLRGRRFTLDELRHSTGLRWALDETAEVFVPLEGGLAIGVHDIAVDVRLRAPYFPIEFQPSVFHAERKGTIVGPDTSSIKFGVSTYSYTDDFDTVMTLEDVMADVADYGATGLEILGESNIPGYPEPSAAWIDTWFSNLDRFGLTPTNYGSWIDTRMWLDRDLTAQEGADALKRDILLASKLGFSFIRPKIGVVSMDLQPHPIWTEVIERSLDLAHEKSIVICPEVHSPTPIKHPVVDEYIEFIERTGTKNFGLLIDTGIFQTCSVLDPDQGFFTEEDVPPYMRALRVPVSDLAEIMKYVVFFQAKFFEMDDQLSDLHIPWDQIFTVLNQAGYTGWLSSEYEGRRDQYRASQMLRRQHALFHQLAARA